MARVHNYQKETLYRDNRGRWYYVNPQGSHIRVKDPAEIQILNMRLENEVLEEKRMYRKVLGPLKTRGAMTFFEVGQVLVDNPHDKPVKEVEDAGHAQLIDFARPGWVKLKQPKYSFSKEAKENYYELTEKGLAYLQQLRKELKEVDNV